MELSLRLDTLGLVEVQYLRTRDRYRDWPQFQLLAASRQARVLAYMSREVIEQLHQQILAVETAVGLDIEFEEEDLSAEENGDETEDQAASSMKERDSSVFSPALAQALDRLNEMARQRLPEGTSGIGSSDSGELSAAGTELAGEDDGPLGQLQDAFLQMMDVVRELAEELATDALKLTGRFRCARTNIVFTQVEVSDDEDEDLTESEPDPLADEAVMEFEVELVMVLQLFEEGRSRADDKPAVELQLDVDDFERLHETLDNALQRDERSRRRNGDTSAPERGRRNRRRQP